MSRKNRTGRIIRVISISSSSFSCLIETCAPTSWRCDDGKKHPIRSNKWVLPARLAVLGPRGQVRTRTQFVALVRLGGAAGQAVGRRRAATHGAGGHRRRPRRAGRPRGGPRWPRGDAARPIGASVGNLAPSRHNATGRLERPIARRQTPCNERNAVHDLQGLQCDERHSANTTR